MNVSKRTVYGIKAITYLAKHQKASLSEISQKEKIPYDYLEKVFRILKKKKIIKAEKGVNGGYRLFKKPSRLKIVEIIKVLEKKNYLPLCVFENNKKLCQLKSFCFFGKKGKEIKNLLKKQFDFLTLEKVLKR